MTTIQSLLKPLARRLKLVLCEIRIRSVKKVGRLLPSKRHKTYDCFLFNNELDLLEIRLSELYEHVDCFVICECATTFAGDKKELHYLANKERFARFQQKIIHFIIPEPPVSAYVENPINRGKRVSQFWQRNQMAVAIQKARDHDLILISDVDEIPSSRVLDRTYKLCYWADSVVYFDQSWHQLFLNVRVAGHDSQVFSSRWGFKNERNDRWLGTFAATAGRLKRRYNWNINGIWGMKWGQGWLPEPVISDAGWHLSYMGGMSAVLKKAKACGMSSISNKMYDDLRLGRFGESELQINNAINDLPLAVQEYPESWKHLCIPQDSFIALACELKKLLSVNALPQDDKATSRFLE